jgi:hypothetical protein
MLPDQRALLICDSPSLSSMHGRTMRWNAISQNFLSARITTPWNSP